jgi:hypothetical protein
VHRTHCSRSQAGPLVVQRMHPRLLSRGTGPKSDSVASRPPDPKVCKATLAEHRMSNGAFLVSRFLISRKLLLFFSTLANGTCTAPGQ